ncbi:MAG TPA: hypothetical protein VLH75_00635 [Longimicrobiales bacterium]|nr:hypothetical protein [Longimicrobiales bacterium]
MNARNQTRSGAMGGATVRDIRTAPGYAAIHVGIVAEGATPTATSAGGSTTPVWASGPASGPSEARTATLGERLMERKLVQWTVAYVAAASWVLQVTSALSGSWNWSAPLEQAVSVLLGMGIIPAVVVAWYHGEKGRQQVCAAECAMVAASVLASVGLVWTVCLGRAF